MKLRSLITTAILFSCSGIMAQDDPEYRMEFGAGLGLTTYEGDFNGAILSGENTSPSGSMMLRRVMNPRSALRFESVNLLSGFQHKAIYRISKRAIRV